MQCEARKKRMMRAHRSSLHSLLPKLTSSPCHPATFAERTPTSESATLCSLQVKMGGGRGHGNAVSSVHGCITNLPRWCAFGTPLLGCRHRAVGGLRTPCMLHASHLCSSSEAACRKPSSAASCSATRPSQARSRSSCRPSSSSSSAVSRARSSPSLASRAASASDSSCGKAQGQGQNATLPDCVPVS